MQSIDSILVQIRETMYKDQGGRTGLEVPEDSLRDCLVWQDTAPELLCYRRRSCGGMAQLCNMQHQQGRGKEEGTASNTEEEAHRGIGMVWWWNHQERVHVSKIASSYCNKEANKRLLI